MSQGPLSRYVFLPAARPLAGRLSRTSLPPGALTGLALLAGLGAGALIAAGWNIAGGSAVLLVALLDAVAAELTRLKHPASRFGAVAEAVAALAADAAMLAGLAVYAFRFEDRPHPEAAAMLALAAVLTVAYASARIEASLGRELARTGDSFLAARDFRLAAFAAGALAGQCYWTLLAVAATGMLAVAWHLAVLRLRHVGTSP